MRRDEVELVNDQYISPFHLINQKLRNSLAVGALVDGRIVCTQLPKLRLLGYDDISLKIRQKGGRVDECDDAVECHAKGAVVGQRLLKVGLGRVRVGDGL